MSSRAYDRNTPAKLHLRSERPREIVQPGKRCAIAVTRWQAHPEAAAGRPPRDVKVAASRCDTLFRPIARQVVGRYFCPPTSHRPVCGPNSESRVKITWMIFADFGTSNTMQPSVDGPGAMFVVAGNEMHPATSSSPAW